MNDPLNNPAPQSPAPGGWTPQQPSPQVPAQPATPASSPFETPTAPAANPVSPQAAPIGSDPIMMEPAAPKSNIGLFIVLGVLLIVGGVVAASMLGWLNFGNFLGGSPEPSPSASVSPSSSPTAVLNRNDQQRKADLANIKTSLQKYYNDKQSYPVATTMEKTTDPNSVLAAALVPTYMAALPVDPLSPNSYYAYKSDGKSYELTATLEDRTDPSGLEAGGIYLYKVTDTSFETPSSNEAAGSNVEEEPTSPYIEDSTSSSSSSSSSSSGSADANSSADAEAILQ